MGSTFKKTATKPLPAGAKIVVRKGQRFAEWTDAKGKRRTAPVTVGKDGSDRIVITARTYTAKYRDGSGIIREVATGCRDESAARSILTELERRADKVRSNLRTAEEDATVDHLVTDLSGHVADFLEHQIAKGVGKTPRTDAKRALDRIAFDCRFRRLADLNGIAVERWLVARQGEGMSARTRNCYRQAWVTFANWCVRECRLLANPFARVPKADEKSDPRRKRRALTEAELVRLLDAARRRPLAEYGRRTIRKPKDTAEEKQAKRRRNTWTKLPLTAEDLDAATERARERLAGNPELIAEMETLGRERALIYKTLVLTGLRKGELASITAGQLVLDAEPAYLVLDAADEKNREGNLIAIRSDLAADLRGWLSVKVQSLRETTTVRFDRDNDHEPGGIYGLPADAPVFIVPRDLVRILDRDLNLAGIPKRDERGRTVDVHALRHTFGTLLSKGGVSPRTAQAAMRHSTIDLTMNVYTDPKLLDVAGAVESLPSLPLGPESGQSAATALQLRATGTDDSALGKFAPKSAPNSDKTATPGSIPVKTAALGVASKKAENPRFPGENQGFSGVSSKAGEGIRTLDIQLGKLSLCQLSYARIVPHRTATAEIKRQNGGFDV